MIFFYDDVINIMLIMTGGLEAQHEILCIMTHAQLMLMGLYRFIMVHPGF